MKLPHFVLKTTPFDIHCHSVLVVPIGIMLFDCRKVDVTVLTCRDAETQKPEAAASAPESGLLTKPLFLFPKGPR